MEPLGLSANRLAKELCVHPNRISEIARGRRDVTADTALRLERYFGASAEMWLNLQNLTIWISPNRNRPRRSSSPFWRARLEVSRLGHVVEGALEDVGGGELVDQLAAAAARGVGLDQGAGDRGGGQTLVPEGHRDFEPL